MNAGLLLTTLLVSSCGIAQEGLLSFQHPPELWRELQYLAAEDTVKSLANYSAITVPENKNAAPHILKAAELLRVPFETERIPTTGPEGEAGWMDKPIGEEALHAFLSNPAKISEEDLRKVRKHVELRRKALDEAHNAALKPRCWFGRDWSQGFKMTLPEFAQFRTLARLFCARALLRWLDNQPHLALMDFKDAFALGRLSQDEPLLIGSLVAAAIDGLTLKAVENAAGLTEADDEKLGRLVALLNRDPVRHPLAGALHLERLIMADLLAQMQTGSLDDETKALLAEITVDSQDGEKVGEALGRPLTEQDAQGFAWYFAATRRLRQLLDGNYWEAHKEVLEVKEFLEKLQESNPSLAVQIIPTLSKIQESLERPQAHRRALICALQARRFYLQENRWPKQLSELCDDFDPGHAKQDPFTGQDLKMKIEESEDKQRDGALTVYSLGPDGKDTQGQRDSEAGADDIRVTVRKPTQPKR